MMLIDWITEGVGGRESSRVWMISVAVATDLASDGLLIGAGASVQGGLAVPLAIGQLMADLPEGAASIMTFRERGTPRRKRLLVSLSFAVPALVAAAGAYVLLRDRPAIVQGSALVVAAGLFSVAARSRT